MLYLAKSAVVPMARKKSFSDKSGKLPVRKNNVPVSSGLQIKWIWISIILLLTFISYYPALKCQFTSWDDPLYILENYLVKNLSFENIKKIFSFDNAVALNYHPVTILSFAIDYHFSKLNPFQYHLVNIIFHLLNTFLVFIFILRLTDKKLFPAVFVSLFFGIHPMHVESVAWISERKDVLYAFFFLSSLLFYLKFNRTKKTKFLVITFLLFILSVLSKAMAVVLPIIMLLIDYFQDRKITMKIIAEKIPFFLVSVFGGIIAINIQLKSAIAYYETFSLLHRISFGFYGFFTYLIKMFVPVHLSSFYPYPLEGSHIAYPVSFYIPVFSGILLFILLAVLFFFKQKKMKPLFFGMGFYFVTILFVLQFISVGQAIMAERYTYISYIGLFFPIGILLNEYAEQKSLIKFRIYFTITIVASVFSYLTFERTMVWKNTGTLWSNVIDQYPYPPWTIELAYIGRGKYYAAEVNDINKAFADFNALVSMKTKNATVYNNLGNIYAVKGQKFEKTGDSLAAKENYQKSIDNFATSISLDSNAENTYVNRATAYIYMKKFELAVSDFNRALRSQPQNIELIEKKTFANYKANNWEGAIAGYDKLIPLIPEKTYLFQYRGFARLNMAMYREAIDDLNIAIQREPANGQTYYYLSVCYFQLNDLKNSIALLDKAIHNGYHVSPEYIKILQEKKLASVKH